MNSDGKNFITKWGPIAISSGAFSGYLPKMPGTWGSLVAVGILFFIPALPFWAYLLLCLGVTLIGVWSCGKARQMYKMVDSPKIVIDEIAGIMVTMIGIPLTGYWLFWGFILFRIFDITKPPPAKYFDSKVHNSWGVMLDDIIAGIYSNIILQLMLRTTI